MNTCSAVGVYISPQIRIQHTNVFLLINQKENQKNPRELQIKGTAISAITLHTCIKNDIVENISVNF